MPKHIEVIELKGYFGVPPKVWIQPVIRSEWSELDSDEQEWGLSKRASRGDLLLMYRCSPACSITDIFRLDSHLVRGKASWRDGDGLFGGIRRVCRLKNAIHLDQLRKHPTLGRSSFIRRNMQGNLLVTENWPDLHRLLCTTNPQLERVLRPYSPERL